MTRLITKAMLVEASACADQVALFAEHFPRGVVPTVARAGAVAGLFNWDWAVRKLLMLPAQKAHAKDIDPALKAYNEATYPARKAYDEATTPARKAYVAADAAAQKAYSEDTTAARKAYGEATAAAFVTAWLEQGKSS